MLKIHYIGRVGTIARPVLMIQSIRLYTRHTWTRTATISVSTIARTGAQIPASIGTRVYRNAGRVAIMSAVRRKSRVVMTRPILPTSVVISVSGTIVMALLVTSGR